MRRLTIEDATGLYDFYVNGLSDRSRELFPPYPLFDRPLSSVEELADRIEGWLKEDDWTTLLISPLDRIIGFGLLKRYKTERPVSGLAVREGYQGKGLGTFIQSAINKEARLLGLKRLYATMAQDNIASLGVHKKCGFKRTGKLVPHFLYKDETIDRLDIEMVLELVEE